MMTEIEARNTIHALQARLTDIKNFNTTTLKKNEHYVQLENIRKLYNKCAEICMVYDPEYDNVFCQYKKAVNQQESKKELDHDLHYCLAHLENSILSHINELENITSIAS